jgi:DNA primase
MCARPDFRAIKARVSMLDVLRRYGIEMKQVNQHELRGRCPLPTHAPESKEISFVVNPAKNVWSCHSSSCVGGRNVPGAEGKLKKGGDLIEFVKFMEKLGGLRDAGIRLEEWFGDSVDSAAPARAPRVAAPVVESESNPALAFTLKDIDHKHPYLAARGFDEEECEYLGAGFFPGRGSMSGRIVFPLHNGAGELVGYAGRLVDDSLISESNPRWKFASGFQRGKVLYNLHRLTEDDWTEAIVVESFWGVLACVRAGIMNVVAIMSNQATDAQLIRLADFSRVTVLLDGDEAGRSGAKNLVERLVNAGVASVDQKVLREGLQPDDLKPDTLRVCLGIPPERDASIVIVPEQSLLRGLE